MVVEALAEEETSLVELLNLRWNDCRMVVDLYQIL